MVLDASKVGRGVTGAVHKLDPDEDAPTSNSSAITGPDLGWISTDGVTKSMPSTGDRSTVRGWQGNGVVFVVRTPTDDLPSWTFVCLETNIAVIETTYNVTVTQSATEGRYVVDTSKPRLPERYVFTVLDDAEVRRDYVPKGVVSEIGDQVFQFGEPIGYEITIEGEFDQELGGNFEVFDTRLKTPA